MDKVIAEHKKEYGVKPSVISQAPGRFHLCGEHSWMFRDKTLSMAVNLPVYVAGSLRDDTSFRFNFVQLEEKKHANLSSLKLKKEDKWANSVKSVLYGFASGNFDLKGIDFTIYTDILPSAGFWNHYSHQGCFSVGHQGTLRNQVSPGSDAQGS